MPEEQDPAPTEDEAKGEVTNEEPNPEKPVYKSNPKHSEPWQPGRRGTLCDKSVRDIAQNLLDDSTLVGETRYAVHDGRAYCAREHETGVWHGHPTGWEKVPAKLRRQWVKEHRVKKRDIDKYWK
jgi:hypothetical protein